MRKVTRLLALTLLASSAGAALADAVSPGALQQLRIDEEARRRQIERAQEQRAAEPKVETPPPGKAAKEPPAEVRFLVRQIRFSPSSIFTAGELEAFARDYEGREQTLSSLQKLIATINAEYRKRGVVTAQAVLPPQNVSSGIVEVRLVEGRLGKIRLEGNDSTLADYITDRIGLKPGDLVTLPALEDDLLRFNRSNDIRLNARLTPGEAFATTDLELVVTEPPRQLVRAFADNGGSRSTGQTRFGLAYFNRSVLGYRDDFSLAAMRSEGQQSYSVSYGVPFDRSGGRVTLAHYLDRTQIRHGPFSSLDITGEARSTILSMRQPLYVGLTNQIGLVGSAKKRRVENWASGVSLNRSETTDGSVGLEGLQIDRNGYWIGNYNYTSGGAENLPRGHYKYGRGWLSRQQNLAPDWSAVASLSVQQAWDPLPLPPGEQMIIGGEGSVRGYPVGTYAGDSGHVVSGEIHHPIGRIVLPDMETTMAADGFFFIDHGRVRPYRPPATTQRKYEELTSAGWGFNTAIGKYVTTRVTISYMFDQIPERIPGRFSGQAQIIVSFF